MKLKLLIIFIAIVTINLYPQPDEFKNSDSTGYKKVLRSYLTAGIGRTTNHLNIGAGLFFPIGENILIGPRANADFEVEIFKTPADNLWNINLQARYIPFISERFIAAFGAGVGYNQSTKRGQFTGKKFLIEEYEKKQSSSVSGMLEIETSILISNSFGINISGYSLFANNKPLMRYQIGLFLCKILDR